MVSREGHCRDDVVCVFAARDKDWLTVDHGVPCRAGGIVAFIGRSHQIATQRPAQNI